MNVPVYDEEIPQYMDDSESPMYDDIDNITIQYDDVNGNDDTNEAIFGVIEDKQLSTLYKFLGIVGILAVFTLIVTWVLHRHKIRRQKNRQIKAGVKSQSSPPKEELRGATLT